MSVTPDATVAVVRVADRPIPAVAPGERPPARWPAELFVTVEHLPTSTYWWDDQRALWDAPASAYVWDGTGSAVGLTDVTCWLQGCTITSGGPDPEGRMDAGQFTATLDNADGRFSQYDPFGRQLWSAPGREVAVWARLGGADWWLFDGHVASWRERADATVEVEAFDFAPDLNQAIGEWNPGTYGDKPEARLAAILAFVGYTGRTRFDVGQVTLHSYLTTASPLEECQHVALSDGGIFGFDADGTCTYRNRSWPGGRADQTVLHTLSDNVCTAPTIVWDAELTTDDEFTVDRARLTNVDLVTADRTAAGFLGRFVLTRTADQWITQQQGDDLAGFIVGRRADNYVRIESFTLHLIDPNQDLWSAGIDLRIGDTVRFLHDLPVTGGTQRIDLNLAVSTITHQITPDTWVVEAATSRAVGNNVLYRWDGPGVAWDDGLAKWGY